MENIHINFKLCLLSLISSCFGGILILVLYKLGYINIQYFSGILLFVVGYILGMFIMESKTN